MTQSELERKLDYKFTNVALLGQALTHRSFGAVHNERLEFLGDSVLNCCIARLVFDEFPAMSEGELSRLRANLVNQTILADVSAQLGLGQLLRLGDGELKTGGTHRPSILADALEAILGAIFLDSDFDSSTRVVQVLFAPRIEFIRNAKPEKDAKTGLQEWLQARHKPLPQYAVASIEGESHQQLFHVECEVASFALKTLGSGASRRLAEQEAAAFALAELSAGAVASASPKGKKNER
ncbi:MAG: ribonuclease III [Betaproteobacteria bacterium]